MVIRTEPIVSEIVYEVNKQSATSAIQFARDTGKELDQDVLIDLQLNTIQIQNQIQNVKQQLRAKDLTEPRRVALEIELGTLKSNLTEARRELQNFRNTGDKEVSRLQAKFNSLDNTIRSQGDALRAAFSGDISGAITGVSSSLDGLSGASKLGAVALGGLTLGLGGLITAFNTVGRQAREFESAFAGVRKTVDGTEEQFAQIESELFSISRVLPVTFTELSKIAELGGQLGVPVEQLGFFTQTVAQLGISTGLSADQISQSFGRILSVTGTSVTEIDRLGATLTNLGNNFAANEGPILDVTQRIAGAGTAAGFTAQELLGLATAVTAVGLNAESGGTTISKALIEINTAVAQGGESLALLAQTAGQTTEQFRKNFEEDASDAFLEFVRGLEREGDNAVNITDELFGATSQVRQAFIGFAQDSELVARALNTANLSFDANTALQEEVNKRLETGASRLQVLRNRFLEAGNSAGGVVNQIVIPALERLTDFILVDIPIAVEVASGEITKIGIRLGAFFGSVRNSVGGALNFVIEGFESFVNSAGSGLNSLFSDIERLGDAVGQSIDLGRVAQVDLGRIAVDEGLSDRVSAQIQAVENEVISGINRINSTAQSNLLTSVGREAARIQSQIEDDFSSAFSSVGSGGGSSAISSRAVEEETSESLQLLKDYAREAGDVQDRIAENAKKAEKEREDVIEGLADTFEDAGERIEEAIEQQEDVLKDLDKEIGRVQDRISGLRDDLSNIDEGLSSDLSSRFVDITNEIESIRSEGGDSSRIQELERELELIRANAEETELQSALDFDRLSETEQIIELARREREEKQLLLQQEEERLAQLQSQRELEQAVFEDIGNTQIALEEQITKVLGDELAKRLGLIQEFEDQRNSIIEGARSNVLAGENTGLGTSTNNNSTTNVNLGGITIQEATDARQVARELQREITRASQTSGRGNIR